MINNINAVNSDYINTVQTAQTKSTTDVDKKAELEKKVYEMAKKQDTLELSSNGKGLSEETINSMRNSMRQNQLSLLRGFVNPTNNAYKGGMSAEDTASLIDAYNTSRYLAKNAFKMYYNKQNDTSEIDDLKNQIAELEKEIGAVENGES